MHPANSLISRVSGKRECMPGPACFQPVLFCPHKGPCLREVLEETESLNPGKKSYDNFQPDTMYLHHHFIANCQISVPKRTNDRFQLSNTVFE